MKRVPEPVAGADGAIAPAEALYSRPSDERRMMNPFIAKLEYGADLTADDRALLRKVSSTSRRVAANTDIAVEGERSENVHVLLEGFACRYKLLEDGRRQIMAIFVPGDMCDLHVQILEEMDHSIAALTNARIVDIPADRIAELTANPRINRALWWATLVDEGTLREWLVSMGQRDAAEQMAHLFCELYVRMRSVGFTDNGGFEFALTQAELADTMGITPVHANRTLMALREGGLVRIEGKQLVIPDFDRLRDFGGFNANYLHLHDRRRGGARLPERTPL